MGFPVAKNPPANVGDPRDMGLIPGSRRSTGKGNGNPLQYCCLLGHSPSVHRVGHDWTLTQRL